MHQEEGEIFIIHVVVSVLNLKKVYVHVCSIYVQTDHKSTTGEQSGALLRSAAKCQRQR